MGNVCTCSPDVERPHVYSEYEILLIIKIQACVRRKLARLRTKNMRRMLNG